MRVSVHIKVLPALPPKLSAELVGEVSDGGSGLSTSILSPALPPKLSVKCVGEDSAGVSGLSTSIDERGRRYTIVEVPGTGLSWREIQHQCFIRAFVHLVHGRLRRIIQQRGYGWKTAVDRTVQAAQGE